MTGQARPRCKTVWLICISRKEGLKKPWKATKSAWPLCRRATPPGPPRLSPAWPSASWSRANAGSAEDHLQRSIAIMEGQGDSSAIADALHLLAGIHCRQGLLEEALQCSRQCLEIKEQQKDRSGAGGSAFNCMGLSQLHRQRHGCGNGHRAATREPQSVYAKMARPCLRPSLYPTWEAYIICRVNWRLPWTVTFVRLDVFDRLGR